MKYIKLIFFTKSKQVKVTVVFSEITVFLEYFKKTFSKSTLTLRFIFFCSFFNLGALKLYLKFSFTYSRGVFHGWRILFCLVEIYSTYNFDLFHESNFSICQKLCSTVHDFVLRLLKNFVHLRINVCSSRTRDLFHIL